MSTQKRESCRREAPERAGGQDHWDPSELARFVRAIAGSGTAPLWSIFWSAWTWAATNFLHKDQPIRQRVQPELWVELAGFPPPQRASHRMLRRHLARQHAAWPEPASSGHPAMPLPPGFAFSLPTLPHVPAHLSRTERHDGKRDLYFLYAA